MSKLRFKGYLYYLIETEDKFIRSKTKQIYGNPSQRIIQIVGKVADTHIVFRSTVDKIDYKVGIDDFAQLVEIKDRINIIPN